jgi:hypothetical protein
MKEGRKNQKNLSTCHTGAPQSKKPRFELEVLLVSDCDQWLIEKKLLAFESGYVMPLPVF